MGTSLAPKIVRNGVFDVEVAKGRFADGVAAANRLAVSVGGFVSASETTALGDDPHGTLTLRVPVARFDDVVGQLSKIGRVRSASTGSQDVTGEYSDVAARINALSNERDQIMLVLGRAQSIPDILSVRDRLTVVQSDLEQLQGRQKVLDDQTSLSTVTMTLSEKGTRAAVTRPVERRGWSALWHDAADRFGNGGRAIALGLATLAPWLLLAAVLWLPARALWRRSARPMVAAPDAGA